MDDVLTPEIVQKGITLNQTAFGNEIDVDPDAIDATIELVNQIQAQMTGKTGNDRIAFIKTCIPGKLGERGLELFMIDYDEFHVARYLCNYILRYASDLAISTKRPSVGIYEVLLVIYNDLDLRQLFVNLHKMTGNPTLPLSQLYIPYFTGNGFPDAHVRHDIINPIFIDVGPEVKLCVNLVIKYIDAVIDETTLQYLINNVDEIRDRESLGIYIANIIHDQMILNQEKPGLLTFKNYLHSVTTNTMWDLFYFLNLPIPQPRQ
jgi:hypothetical protein